jgi:hypothetical protein
MSRRATLVGITGLCATLAACSGSPAQAPPPTPPKPSAALPAAPVVSAPVASAPAASVPTPQTVTPGTAAPGPAPAAPVMATPVTPAAVSASPAPMAAVPTAPGQAGPAQPVGAVTRAAQAPAPQAPAPALVPAAPSVPQSDAPAYETKGRRDPFTTLDVVTGPTGLTVATTKLTGIVRGKSTLALLETSDGIGYILRTGDTLGDGRLVEIGADNVVFAVAAKPGAPPSRVVLKLAAK